MHTFTVTRADTKSFIFPVGIHSKRKNCKKSQKKLAKDLKEKYIKHMIDESYDEILDDELYRFKKAKYIASILSSDNDELIYFYIKKLNIDHLFQKSIAINKMIDEIHLYSKSYGGMIEFILYLLTRYKI
jgi:hypothetical protein